LVNKAWIVSDQVGSVVVFAPRKNEALEAFYGEEGGNCAPLYSDPVVRRAKKYDQYADRGRVPAELLIADGWEVPCRKCSYMVGKKELSLGARVDGDKVYCQFCAGELYEEELMKSAGGEEKC